MAPVLSCIHEQRGNVGMTTRKGCISESKRLKLGIMKETYHVQRRKGNLQVYRDRRG